MNKRQLKKLITLYREGLSCEICISVMLDLMRGKSTIEIAMAIHAFYESLFDLNLKTI